MHAAWWAAEMEPFDQSIGDFSVHYAGFFDPGFGYGAAGEIKGTRAVLEVRAHEVPLLLEDRQIVGRLVYHRMANAPEKLYGQAIGSSYQKQGLALSKQFGDRKRQARAAKRLEARTEPRPRLNGRHPLRQSPGAGRSRARAVVLYFVPRGRYDG